MADMSVAAKNDLPDSSFAVVLPGGRKDGNGRTVPRGLRKFPIYNADGTPDPPRVRNALSRIEQDVDMPEAQRSRAKNRIRAAAVRAGIGEPAKEAKK
jgi:hypothetical protein